MRYFSYTGEAMKKYYFKIIYSRIKLFNGQVFNWKIVEKFISRLQSSEKISSDIIFWPPVLHLAPFPSESSQTKHLLLNMVLPNKTLGKSLVPGTPWPKQFLFRWRCVTILPL